jgi:phage head maturation protease
VHQSSSGPGSKISFFKKKVFPVKFEPYIKPNAFAGVKANKKKLKLLANWNGQNFATLND